MCAAARDTVTVNEGGGGLNFVDKWRVMAALSRVGDDIFRCVAMEANDSQNASGGS